MKTAVLIHGYHLQSRLDMALADDRSTGIPITHAWEDLAIGAVDGAMARGRATYGVVRAWHERADVIIFSTGASEKDGLKEAEYTYREVLKRVDALASHVRADPGTFRAWLTPRVRLDVDSQTTAEELKRNLTWCHDEGYHRVILVTNRFHVPRALANANDVSKVNGLHELVIMACAPYDVSPAPVIFEPPTRPDRDAVDFRPTLSKIFGLPADRKAAALADIEAVIAKHLG